MGGFDEQINKVGGPAGFKFASGNLGDVITVVLNYAFALAGIGLLLFFLYGGFQLFLSGGDQKKVSEGKATITNAILGFVIVFVAFWIVQLVGRLLGLTSLFGAAGIF